MFIINPQLSDEDTEKTINGIQDEIKKNDGQIVHVQSLGKQLLAYPIKKFRDGYYVLVYFEGAGKLIEKISPRYRINENIIRNLILKNKKPFPVPEAVQTPEV